MDESHLDGVIAVHRAAFPDYMNTSLGTGYLKSFLRGFLSRSDTVTRVALGEQGGVVGYLAGAPVSAGSEMNRALIPAAVRAVALRPWLLFTSRIRTTAWNRLTARNNSQPEKKPAPELPPNTLSLVSVGVHPHARGRGIGEQLVQSFEAEAHRQGVTALRLSVYPSNRGARQFYERLHWKPFREDVPPNHAMYYFKVLSTP